MSIWLIVWAIFHLFWARAVLPNAIMWLSYYAVNYEFGFVRRGLAGELTRIFPDTDYFTAAYTILWACIVVWLIALAALMWLILSTGARSERRIMLALAVPVLPFGFSYAVYKPYPEIFGMTALLAFSISLTKAGSPRSRMILSGLYGIAVAVLALMHEAIPLELALGAILAIVVLSKDATHAAQRICTLLARAAYSHAMDSRSVIRMVVALLIGASVVLVACRFLAIRNAHGDFGHGRNLPAFFDR